MLCRLGVPRPASSARPASGKLPAVSLAAGTQLGAHQIVGLLGAGGMGEVYRARDTKLNRQVAIKILPSQYAADADRIARFEREAQAVAALNHPGIAAIYEFNHVDGLRFLVLELVEGDTLADVLRQRGPLDLEQALTITRDICAALEAAHEKGICHRDLKPANVKLTPDGAVKVLDFGLAKILEPNPAAPALTDSPTLSLAGTYPGVILGTAGYMSPEQAKGFAADHRSDIFSVGCILYELLTGRRAFEGDSASDVLAAVLKTEPDLTKLPAGLNPRIVDLLRRCLEKNPKRRWHSVADVRVELDTILERRAFTGDAHVVTARAWWRLALPVAIALVAGTILGAFVMNAVRPHPSAPVTRFIVVMPEGRQLAQPNRALLALSNDSTKLVYHATTGLFVRDMSGFDDGNLIPGTEKLSLSGVVFSPDGRSVAFQSYEDRALKRIAVTGGAPVTICPIPTTTSGITWNEDGLLFGVPGKGIYRVSPNGGTPELIVAEGQNESVGGAQMLPGGRTILFSVAEGDSAIRWDSARIVAQRLGSSERIPLIDGGSEARYIPTGHIVYALSGTLLAVRFDLERLRVLGGPVPIVEGVRRTQSAANSFQAAQFTFSNQGALAYVPGPVAASIMRARLAIVDRNGGTEPLNVPPAPYVAPRVAPNGRFVAVTTDYVKEAAISIYELAGKSAIQRLTFGGKSRYPIWSGDSEWVAYQSDREGDLGIFRQRADGTGAVERVTKAEKGTSHIPHAWSPVSDVILFSVRIGERYALWSVDVRNGRMEQWGQVESGVQGEAEFSPDGKWVAYQSGESGQQEIYVQPATGRGPKYMVPHDLSNHHPLWSRTGGELFYIPRQGAQFAIRVTTSPRFSFGEPMPVERAGRIEGPALNRRNHDVLPDGRFIGVVQTGDRTNIAAVYSTRINVVLNWFDELKQRVPR
jgi:Tol biopolymer transport system component